MSRRVKTLPEQYKPRLTKFMSFKDARNYDNDHQFSTEELASVTPQQIVITSIINEMRKHRRNGGHPSLHDTRI